MVCHSLGWMMKYLVLLLLVLAFWTLVTQFLTNGLAQEGPSFLEQLKGLGRNFHFLVGMAAVLIIVVVLARLIYLGLR
jgi:hypothetical protein